MCKAGEGLLRVLLHVVVVLCLVAASSSSGGVSSHIYLRSIASNVTLKAFCLMPYSFWQKFCRSISSLLLSQTIRCLLDGVVMLLLPEKRTQCQTPLLLPKNLSFQQLSCYLNNNLEVSCFIKMSQRFKNTCFLKEIGVSKHFVIRKSEIIGKIGKMKHKRHLAIFAPFSSKIK